MRGSFAHPRLYLAMKTWMAAMTGKKSLCVGPKKLLLRLEHNASPVYYFDIIRNIGGRGKGKRGGRRVSGVAHETRSRTFGCWSSAGLMFRWVMSPAWFELLTDER